MSRQPPTIPCFACSGHGTIPLPAALHQTLEAVGEIGEARAEDVHKHLGGERETGVGITAINNRLRQLAALGLVEPPRRFGKALLWKVAAAGRSPR